MLACTIEFPVNVGDIVNVKITSLPMSKHDLDTRIRNIFLLE